MPSIRWEEMSIDLITQHYIKWSALTGNRNERKLAKGLFEVRLRINQSLSYLPVKHVPVSLPVWCTQEITLKASHIIKRLYIFFCPMGWSLTNGSQTCADHQGGVRNMAGLVTWCWLQATVEALLGLMGPDKSRAWWGGGAGEKVAPDQGQCKGRPSLAASSC